jgi:predicted DNA-binding transcriptional regulator AlpA
VSTPPRNHIFIKELAALRGLNEYTVYHWLREAPHRLPTAYRWGGRVVFKTEDVEAWQGRELVPYHSPSGKKRGRPTKAEEIARRKQLEGAAA